MTERRVPAWFVAVGRDSQAERVYQLFRDVLELLPMSASELARRLGVSQPTVSRWAGGSANPSLEEMTHTLTIVDEHLAGVHGRVRYAQRILELVKQAVDETRSEGSAEELRAVRAQLREALASD